MPGEGIGKFEARRNVESFFRRVHTVQASQDTTAWKKKAKPYHKPVDGHKLMRQRMIKEENVTLNRKLNRIMSEDRKGLTKEYAPGFRVGNVSGGQCIDCYRTDNPLSLAYDKLHNRKQIRDRETMVIARHNAELKANINKLRSPYSAQECDKFYKDNRYRARFFLERKEDPHTSKHLGLDPRERRRKKYEQKEERFYEMNHAAHQTDALGKAEALSEALSRMDLHEVAGNPRRKEPLEPLEGKIFIASGNRTGGHWEPDAIVDKDCTAAERKKAERLVGTERAGTPGYQFGLSMERLMDASLTPIHTPSRAYDDGDFSSFTSTFPLPFNQDVSMRPFSAGAVPAYHRHNGVTDNDDGEVRSDGSEKVQDVVPAKTLKIAGKKKEEREPVLAAEEVRQSPRSNERNLLRELIRAKSKQASFVEASTEHEPRKRQMRVLVQDEICVSDYGEIKRLSEFPGFEHIVTGSDRDVDISTSSGLLIEVDGAKDVFLDMKSIVSLVLEKGERKYSALHQALSQLACLDHTAGLYECISDLNPEVEAMLGDFLLGAIHTNTSRRGLTVIELY